MADCYAASYDPYGVPLPQTGSLTSPLGFTGEYTDPSGLIYRRARYMHPALGAFLTRDPVLGVVGKSQTYNSYIYVQANPTNLTDPSGAFPGLGVLAVACPYCVVGIGIGLGVLALYLLAANLPTPEELSSLVMTCTSNFLNNLATIGRTLHGLADPGTKVRPGNLGGVSGPRSAIGQAIWQNPGTNKPPTTETKPEGKPNRECCAVPIDEPDDNNDYNVAIIGPGTNLQEITNIMNDARNIHPDATCIIAEATPADRQILEWDTDCKVFPLEGYIGTYTGEIDAVYAIRPRETELKAIPAFIGLNLKPRGMFYAGIFESDLAKTPDFADKLRITLPNLSVTRITDDDLVNGNNKAGINRTGIRFTHHPTLPSDYWPWVREFYGDR